MVCFWRTRSVWLVLAVLFVAVTARADGPIIELRVAADGSGEFSSIQAAVDSIPVDHPARVIVHLRNGSYNERVRIDRSRVTLRGQSREGTRIFYNFPRSEYDRRYDRIGPGVVNVFGDDVIFEHVTIENTQPDDVHAFAVYGQPNRMILDDCSILGVGGDTLSLWNTSFGMYYHRNCTFRGGVDFVCPRGWCFVRDAKFEPVGTSAAIWHDGHIDYRMKFVIKDSEFSGPPGFWLGRNHYPSQFYLLNCRFGENMADKPILTVSEPKPGVDPALYERKYFYGCHRTGGDYQWFADNLHAASGAPMPSDVTAAWTFDGLWDPERQDTPVIEKVETEADQVYVQFSEPMIGAPEVAIVRTDGSRAKYDAGNGRRLWTFAGGNIESPPAQVQAPDGAMIAATATLKMRRLESTSLPKPETVEKLVIALAGDSTVADYPPNRVEQGWGQALPLFFDRRVVVRNLARNGRSSKSFRSEGWWAEVLEQQPDFVLIQFGHNDNRGKGPERETDPAPGGDFRENLRRYVNEVRAIGATPVLISPATRRHYLADGTIDPDKANVAYAQATQAVAEEMDCAFVDLNRLTRDLFHRLEESHSHWMQPEGDRTHFTAAGAQRVAALVVAQLRHEVPTLQAYIDLHRLTRP